jgi:hypothetical protein
MPLFWWYFGWSSLKGGVMSDQDALLKEHVDQAHRQLEHRGPSCAEQRREQIVTSERDVDEIFQRLEHEEALCKKKSGISNFFRRLINSLREVFGHYNDEPENRVGMIIVGKRRIWPRSTEYRIVDYELDYHRYGIQAKVGNDWVDLQTYNNGYDIYGKLHAGRWMLLRMQGRWSLNNVKQFINKLLSIPEVPKVINEKNPSFPY